MESVTMTAQRHESCRVKLLFALNNPILCSLSQMRNFFFLQSDFDVILGDAYSYADGYLMDDRKRLSSESLPVNRPVIPRLKRCYAYDPEMREEIARFAIVNGISLTARKYTVMLGHPINTSTVHRMRASYMKRCQMFDNLPESALGENSDV